YDAMIPFLNASIEPLDKQIRTLLKLGSIGRANLDGAQGRRLLVALSSAAALTWLYWLLRHDDDDYKEQEDWLKRGYWSWGSDGVTYIRVGRSREWGFVSSLMEALMNEYYDNADDAIADAVKGELRDRIPSGG